MTNKRLLITIFYLLLLINANIVYSSHSNAIQLKIDMATQRTAILYDLSRLLTPNSINNIKTTPIQNILRSVLIGFLTNDFYDLKVRYMFANFYNLQFSNFNEDLVLSLLAYETSKLCDAEVLYGSIASVVFKQFQWCILFIHGSLTSNFYRDQLVGFLSSHFKLVIVASCYSSYYSFLYPNVLGFSGVTTFSSVLSLLSTFSDFSISSHEQI